MVMVVMVEYEQGRPPPTSIQSEFKKSKQESLIFHVRNNCRSLKTRHKWSGQVKAQAISKKTPRSP